MDFTTSEAKEYAVQGRIEEWVHAFLSGPANNHAFTEGLQKAPRWWVGPIEIALNQMKPALGPSPEYEYAVEPEPHNRYVNAMVESLRQGWQPTPLILEYRGYLSVRDGNHRYHALQRLGADQYWVIIYFNSQEDFDQLVEHLAGTS